MKCFACGEQGHQAFFCPFSSKPYLGYDDSGCRAYFELPYNTHRWALLKELRRDALADLLELAPHLPKDDADDVLEEAIGKGFAAGWRYCCVKKHYNNPSHKAEAAMLRPNTTATATSDSSDDDSSWD